MLTRCPKCQTLFRISESQLQRARGKTRCGQCFTVFEATEATVEENTERTPQRRPQRRPQTSAPPPAEKNKAPQHQPGMTNAASSIYNEMVIKNQSVKYDIPDTLDDDDEEISDFQMPSAPAPQPNAAPQNDPHSEEVTRRIAELRRKANQAGLQPKISKTLDAQLNQGLQPTPTRAETNESSFIPDVLQDDLYEEVHVPSARKNFYLILGILAFLFVMLLQYVYFMRNELASNNSLHPHLVKFCNLFNCTVPYKKNLSKMDIRNFDASRAGTKSDVGSISGVLVNTAKHIQAYPTIELRIKNKDGKLVAMRRIPPKGYVSKSDIKNGFPPRGQVPIEFKYKIPTREDPSVNIILR